MNKNIISLTKEKNKRNIFFRILKKIINIVISYYWKLQFYKFGKNSILEKPFILTGKKAISIGNNVKIWKNARLETFNNDNKIKLEIGDDSVIHPFVHIGAGEKIKIGKGVLIASYVYITDHDHDFSDPYNPVIFNGKIITSQVEISDYVWIGEKAMILKGVKVGERSIIGAGSIVTKDIPPLSIAIGSPAKVISIYNPDKKKWIKV